MSVARLRALTPPFLDQAPSSKVEMSVARLRALTHLSADIISERLQSRNECGPLEGIDTSV